MTRNGSDGLALEFVFRNQEAERSFGGFLTGIPAQTAGAVLPE